MEYTDYFYNNYDFFSNVIDLNCAQIIKAGERTNGDVYLVKNNQKDSRYLVVLADGLGSGIKANVLATLTATMIIQYLSENIDVKKAAKIIMKTLPKCKVRKLSYSTFTILDINKKGLVKILEYDNPDYLYITKNNEIKEIHKKYIKLQPTVYRNRYLKYSELTLNQNDKIVFYSDGVSQSENSQNENRIKDYIKNYFKENENISSLNLSNHICGFALRNDNYSAKDDISTCSLFYRQPKNLIILTGPPLEKKFDNYICQLTQSFPGKKVICGGTTAKIFSREADKKMYMSIETSKGNLPPVSKIEGVDLVTEGIITLNRVYEILLNNSPDEKRTPANILSEIILASDNILFITGKNINIYNYEDNIPYEKGIRAIIVNKLKEVLENNYLKKVYIEYF